MASVFKVSDLEARKRAAVADCEVYRHMLTLELEHIRLYRESWRRKFSFFKTSRLLLLLIPVGLTLFGLKGRRRAVETKPASGWKRILSTAVLAWRVYRKVGPALAPLISQLRARRRTTAQRETSLPRDY